MTAVLIYDGRCNFCRTQADRLVRLSGGRLRLESFRDPGVIARYPGLTEEACDRAMQLVTADGKITAGAEAAAQIIRLNPWLGWASWIYYLPGIRQISDAAYRWIARNRFRFGGTCDLPKGSHP